MKVVYKFTYRLDDDKAKEAVRLLQGQAWAGAGDAAWQDEDHDSHRQCCEQILRRVLKDELRRLKAK